MTFSLTETLSKSNTDITEAFRFNIGTSFNVKIKKVFSFFIFLVNNIAYSDEKFYILI